MIFDISIPIFIQYYLYVQNFPNNPKWLNTLRLYKTTYINDYLVL